ncbi:TPA: ead/Ea22-like family protein [Klebsiella pneumoniae]|nr:ead/Ea22-like family protein [Klebsiella pneumoniae]
MTDITELAQRMRIAATMASQGAWSYARSGFNSIVRTSANLPSGGASRVVLCKLFRSEWRGELKTAQDAQFIALANPANVLSLVEALEKAQQRIGKLEKKLTDHKRMNQEMAKAMLTPNDSDAAGMEIAALRQRIAELESRTVKLPEPFKLAKSSSVLTYYYADEVDAALTAAGIKVEAE